MSTRGVDSAENQVRITTFVARRRLTLASIGAIGSTILFSSVAFADTKQECVDAYDKVQDQRDAGKLEEAIEEAKICARDTCSKAVRDDCAKWKTELEAREATIVVVVVDASGRPVTDGSVSLDGARWLEHLDHAPHVVSQGPHTLEVTAGGPQPGKQSIVIQEGEKNRAITIAIPAAAPGPPPPPPPPLVHSVGPWVIGSVGAAALIGGAVTGGIVVHAHSVMKDQCNDTSTPKKVGNVILPGGRCTQRGFDAEQRGHTLGPATTALLIGGGALVTAGVIWLVARPHPTKQTSASWVVVPTISADQKGVALVGSF